MSTLLEQERWQSYSCFSKQTTRSCSAKPSALCAAIDSSLVMSASDEPGKIALNVAAAAGELDASAIHAELGVVLAGRRPGRERDVEITIFAGAGTWIDF